MVRIATLTAVLAGLPVAFVAPQGCARKKGGLVLAMSTDMRAPKDVNAVGVTVSTNNVIRTSFIARVAPDGEVKLPATLAIVQPDDENATIRIRVLALQESKVRVLRDVRTTVPRDGRIALLRIPLNFINDESAVGQIPAAKLPPFSSRSSSGVKTLGEQPGGEDPTEAIALITSTCPGNHETVVDGQCIGDSVDSSSLPEFSDALVRAGGASACFDTARCFTEAREASVDREKCKATVTGKVEQLNVALATESTGECVAPGRCLVPLDRGPSGWQPTDEKASGGAVLALAKGICKKIAAGAKLLEANSTTCPPKTEANPVCQSGSTDAGAAVVDTGQSCLPPGADCTAGDRSCCVRPCEKGVCPGE